MARMNGTRDPNARPAAPVWRLRPLCAALFLAGAQHAVLAAGPAAGLGNLPSGGQVVSGQVTVQTVSPNQMNITETSATGIINWQNFSIGQGSLVRVYQPGASATLLNRVVGVDPSLILGRLQANGRVFLINPRGIVFGRESQIDAGSFVASTLDMRDQDFLAGKYSLLAGPGTPGSIEQDGSISAPGGTVALVAPRLSVNGDISAQRVGLAAASSVQVDVEGDGLVLFNVANTANLDTRLDMLGRIHADGGTVDMRAQARAGFADTVLNMQGIVQARAIGSRNGQVVIDGGSAGITQVGGSVDVSGKAAGETGGSVKVLGDMVGLTTGAVLDASGNAGGGQIRVGGDFHGAGSDRNASYTTVQSGVTLDADALGRGNGGGIAVWSNLGTDYYGSLSARGGAGTGDGGFAEVSGKRDLLMRGGADLSASGGKQGTLLLDPYDLVIASSGNDTTLPAAVGGTSTLAFGSATSGTSTVLNTDVGTLLATANVVLQASDNITVNATITGTGSPAANRGALTLDAGNNITVNSNITTLGRDITLTAGDAAATNPPTTVTGLITIASGAQLSTRGTSGTLTSGNIALTGNAISITTGSTSSVVAGGNITAAASSGDITQTGTTTTAFKSVGSTSLTASAGQVNLDAATAVPAIQAGGNIILSADSATPLSLPSLTSTGGNVQVTSTGANIVQDTGAVISVGAADSSFSTPTNGTSINLGNNNNLFGGNSVIINTNTAAANNAAIKSDSVVLAGSTIGGNLSVEATSGGISQAAATDAGAGPLVTGASGSVFKVDGTNQTINLGGYANAITGSTFGGVATDDVQFSGERSLALRNTGAIVLDTMTLAGSLIVISGSSTTTPSITQNGTTSTLSTGGGATFVANTAPGLPSGTGTSTSTGTAGVITVANSGNSLSGNVLFDGSTVQLGTSGALKSAGHAVSSLTETAGGDISEAGGITLSGTTPTASFTSSSNNAAGATIDLTNSGNKFGDATLGLHFTGTAPGPRIGVVDSGTTFPTVTLTVPGTVTASSAYFGSSGTNEAIALPGLVLAGPGTLANLSGTSDALYVSSSGNVSQQGTTSAIVVSGSGTAQLSAPGKAIDVSHSGNDFTGWVNFSGSGITIVNAGALELAGTASGTTTATGLTSATATTGNLTVGDATHAFHQGAGGLTFSGADVSVTATGNLASQGTATGALSESTSATTGPGAQPGNISQTGVIQVGTVTTTATTTVTADGGNANITLGAASGNTFTPASAGGVTFNGSTVNITTTGALASQGTAATLSETAGGAISQTGAISVTGSNVTTITANAGASNISLGAGVGGNAVGATFAPGNSSVTFNGAAVAIASTGALASQGSASTLSESAAGVISETGVITTTTPGSSFSITGGTPFDIRLGTQANAFAATTPASGPTLGSSGSDVNFSGEANLGVRTAGPVTLNSLTLPSGGQLKITSGSATGTPGIAEAAGATITAPGGAIFVANTVPGAPTTAGAATSTGTPGTISVGNTSNSFGGPVFFDGADVTLASAAGLTTAGRATSSLTETAAGNIAEGTAGITITGTTVGAVTTPGTASFTTSSTATGATIALDDGNTTPSNAFNGAAVTVTFSGNPTGAKLALADSGSSFPAPTVVNATGSLSSLVLRDPNAAINLPQVTLSGASSANPNAAGGTDTLVVQGASIAQGSNVVDVAAGTTSLDAGTGSINLPAATNVFAGPVTLTGGAVTLNATGNLSTASTGTLTSLSETVVNGAISQSGPLAVSGLTSVSASGTGNDISLGASAGSNAATSTFTAGSGVQFSGGNVSITSTGALASSGTASGALSEAAGGAISQIGAVSVTGAGLTTVNANAGASDITLGAGGGNASTSTFTPGSGGIQFLGRNVRINSTGAIASAGTATNNLTEIAAGAINQIGAINVVGTGLTTVSANAGAADITLGAGGSNASTSTFTAGTGGVAFTGNNVSINSTNALTSQGTAAALLSETAGGNISDSGNITAGSVQVNAGTHDIALGSGSHVFSPGSSVAFLGHNVSLTVPNALVSQGTATGALSETTGGGQISQSGAIVVGTTTTVTAQGAGNAITLGPDTGINAAGSTFTPGSGGVTFNGGAVTITSTGALASQGSASGALSEIAAGAITQTGPITVAGLTSVNAGANPITLGGSAGSFTPGAGGVAFNGSAVSITVPGALQSEGSASSLAESANGPISQGSGVIAVTGTSSFDAHGNAITLGTSSGGSFTPGGNVAVNGSNVTLASTAGLSSSGTVSGTLSESAAGPISQGGALTVAGTSSFNAGANTISLGGSTTPFTPGGAVAFNGSDVSIASTGGLASSGTASGTLTESAVGGLSQSGDISAHAVNLTASGAADLANLTVANGGQISADTVALQGNLNVQGGQLVVVASAAPTASSNSTTPLFNKLGQVPGAAGVGITINNDVVTQTAGAISVATGAELDVKAIGTSAEGSSSVSLNSAANNFLGGVSVLTGPAFGTAWSLRPQQSEIVLAGQQVNVVGSGLEGDIIHITASKGLSTQGSAAIVARLPYSNQEGTTNSEPDLLLNIPLSALGSLALGSGGSPVKIAIGATQTGNRTSGPNSGYVTVQPVGVPYGASAVFLAGPNVNQGGGGYQFFYDGSNKVNYIPVFYNGLLPQTPQLAGALSSVAAVSEQARRDRFEETVRTENVANRLRVGVISEVGPGRPATTGTEGAAPPEVCAPAAGGGLSCGADGH